MHKIVLYFLSIIFLFLLILTGCEKEKSAGVKIGIILPIEHKALQDIVAGFSQKLKESYPHPIQIKIMNAQGDINLQRAIVQQMRDQNYALIVPIATGTTQMTSSMVHDQPIVSLAAEMSDSDRKKLAQCNIAIVHDEIPPQLSIAFIHAAYPNLHRLTLIHSTSDKIFPEVNAAISAGKKLNIDVKPLMVATLPELMSTMHSLRNDTQGIFILKDNLIASGISTIIKTSQDKKIPLITSDQGTVENGASFSLGVKERKIGEAGAILAQQILAGQSPCDLPIVEMKKLSVFINKKRMTKAETIIATAKQLNYQIELIEN